jgi:CRP/FNR family transcriptional regulator, dissimilatory nitrate respiration regulator
VELSIVDILRSCRLFSQVQPAGFAQLAAIGRLCKFRKGELVFRERQECPGVYVVGSGLVRVYRIAPNGKEHILHMVGPGNTFAEVAAIGGFPCPANAEAVSATTCALLPLDLFRKALEENHQLCLEMMTGMSAWVHHLVTLMEDLVLRDAVGRIARFLLDSAPAADGTIELPSLKRHLASHLNLTSETFSRTLSRLIEDGLVVELEGNRLRLVDPQRLRALAYG